MAAAIMWFRRDLRLEDNPAWNEATAVSDRVLPVFCIDPRLWQTAHARRLDALTGNLRALDGELATLGGCLHITTGIPEKKIPEVAGRFKAARIFANRDYGPFARRRDDSVAGHAPLALFDGGLVHPPGTVLTTHGEMYRVFGPFYRRWILTQPPDLGAPGTASVESLPGDELPGREVGKAGEPRRRLRDFLAGIETYGEGRGDGTSRLSIDLKFGTIAAQRILDEVGDSTESRRAFTRQLAWRDFWAHLLWAYPELATTPLRSEFKRIEWNDDPDGLEAWKRGQTGYPIVDAAMRQLLSEGWIHNRLRMITASFLVKDLLIDWRLGERHFRHHLLDGDVAQNVGNWQWVAGVGADAAPYFRVFNPILQSRKLDPSGDYIRKHIPELDQLGPAEIHEPWKNPEITPQRYPAPLVDHAAARRRAIAAYDRAKSG